MSLFSLLAFVIVAGIVALPFVLIYWAVKAGVRAGISGAKPSPPSSEPRDASS
jgi:hypothetical protein